jgi:hypothetical protein
MYVSVCLSASLSDCLLIYPQATHPNLYGIDSLNEIYNTSISISLCISVIFIDHELAIYYVTKDVIGVHIKEIQYSVPCYVNIGYEGLKLYVNS